MSTEQKIALAQKLYNENRVDCFWYCKPDFVVREEHIPIVAKGLREHGSREARLAATPLEQKEERR